MNVSVSKELITIAAVVVGASITFAFTEFREHKQRKRQLRGLAAALHAEIKTQREAAIRYRYRDTVEFHLTSLRNDRDVEMPKYTFESDPLKSVFYSNLRDIGFFPKPLPEDLTRLYAQANTIIIDFQDMNSGKWDNTDPEKKIAYLEGFLENYDDTVTLAHKALADLENEGLF